MVLGIVCGNCGCTGGLDVGDGGVGSSGGGCVGVVVVVALVVIGVRISLIVRPRPCYVFFFLDGRSCCCFGLCVDVSLLLD